MNFRTICRINGKSNTRRQRLVHPRPQLDPAPRPLTLDLDGDGLETTGIDPNNPILFDHDGDGVKNATGWVRPDDGFLVLDRDGNGTIDNGTELFGDSTPLSGGGKAEDGFAALADQDTNGDGRVDANDANFNNLRVWQDLNQDGISQNDELFTLAEKGIAAIHVAKTENTTVLSNGNQIADLGHFTYADGSEGTLGQVTGGIADIDLADNPFYREFTDRLDTSGVAGLPDMQGSGAVRDLREASSLSGALANTVTAYAQADTKAGQLALADQLIAQWAQTSGASTSIDLAAAQNYELVYLIPGLTAADFAPVLFGAGAGGGSNGITLPDPQETQRREALKAQQASVTSLIALLEKFNGLPFVNIEPQGVRTGAQQFLVANTTSGGSAGYLYTGPRQVFVNLSGTQIDFLNKSYAALRESIYDGLLLQTRLKPYLNDIELAVDAGGNVMLDFTAITADFQARFDTAPPRPCAIYSTCSMSPGRTSTASAGTATASCAVGCPRSPSRSRAASRAHRIRLPEPRD